MDRRARMRLLAVGVAVGALVAAAVVTPVPGDPDHLTLFGHPFGQECPILALTGLPCPSCGMTRSWVWAVRGDLGLALRYNAAGVGVLAGAVTNGLVRAWLILGGGVPRWGRTVAIGVAAVWGVVWIGGWGLRLGGVYLMP